jgi:hypothetical protein
MSYDDEEDFDLADELAGMDDIATGSKLLPEEEYVWSVVDAKYKKAKTGTQGINVTLEIADGPYRGSRVFDDIWYSEKAVTMFWGRMKKFGITSEWARETGNTKLSRMAELIKGTTIVASIKHDDYNGDERAKINRYIKLIGENQNLAGAASGAVTGVVAPPAAATLPDLPEEPAEQIPVAAGAISTDDPWGAADDS